MDDRIKVLMVGPDRSVHGGISGVVNNYYDAGITEKVDLNYIGTMVEGSRLRKLWQAVKAYIKFLKLLPEYPIVHVNVASDSSYYRKSLFIKAAKRAGKKIVVHQHGGDFETFYEKEQNDRGRAKIRQVLGMGDVFLVLSPVLEQFFKGILDPSKVILFPNAVPVPDSIEKEYGKQRILFLGRLCKEKGLRELFSVLPQLHEQFPQMRLLLGGIWEDEELREEVAKMKEYVTDLGWLQGEAKKDYLRISDLFVFPTYFEGQPVSVLEAMAYQCGIVATRVGGIPQMIEQEQTGLLIEPKDQEGLKSALEKLLSDPELCERLGKNARVKIEKEFSIEKSLQELIKIYQQLV
jgi:glycosyltransferase involved in cell wall biosynthesis